jgi:hypothetical protein
VAPDEAQTWTPSRAYSRGIFPDLRDLRKLRTLLLMDHKLSPPPDEARRKGSAKRLGAPEAQQAVETAANAARAAAHFIVERKLVDPRVWVEGDVLRISAYDIQGKKVSIHERVTEIIKGGHSPSVRKSSRYPPASPARGPKERKSRHRFRLERRRALSPTSLGTDQPLADLEPASPDELVPVPYRGRAVRSVPLHQFLEANALSKGGSEARQPTEESSPSKAATTEHAMRTGHAYLLSLIRDGSLIGSDDLAQAWGVTPQALRQLADAGDLVAIKVNNKLRYPVELTRFDSRSDAQALSRRLAGLPEIERVLFMLNEHAGLQGKTVSQAFKAGQGDRALALADRMAESE